MNGTHCMSISSAGDAADVRIVVDGLQITGGSVSWSLDGGATRTAEPLTGTREARGSAVVTGPEITSGQPSGTITVNMEKKGKKFRLTVDGHTFDGSAALTPCTGD